MSGILVSPRQLFCFFGDDFEIDKDDVDYAYDFNLGVSAGDEIKLTVTATGTTAGNAVIENVTTGKSVTKTFTSGQVQGDLCRTNAEWIVEDVRLCSIPFCCLNPSPLIQ